MERHSFISSALVHGKYDAATMRMDLTFTSGKAYSFCRVPPHVWAGLKAASSSRSYYNDHIRDRYQC